MTKTCKICKKEKPLNEFTKNYAKKIDGSPVGDGRRSNCKTCENQRRKLSYQKNIKTRMLMNSKARARANGWKHTLTLEDIKIPKVCPLLKVPFEIGVVGNYPFTPTLDRIDSTLGYTKENIKVVTMLANRIKSNATKEQLIEFSKNIQSYYK